MDPLHANIVGQFDSRSAEDIWRPDFQNTGEELRFASKVIANVTLIKTQSPDLSIIQGSAAETLQRSDTVDWPSIASVACDLLVAFSKLSH